MAFTIGSAVLLGLLWLPTSVRAAWVTPTSVTASSSLPESEGVSYDASNIVDHKVSTVWVEGEEGSGLGSWLLLELDGPHELRSIRIWNGNWYSWDFWNRHNRVKELEVEFSDGSTRKFTLKDEKAPETLTFDKPVRTTSVKLRVKAIYRGTTFNDTCISEVVLEDTRPDDFALPVAVADSGHLPEDADGTYLVENTYDSVLDTMWCENQKKGDGTGSWIEYRYGSPVTLSKLVLRNGNTYDLKFWMKSNRATAGTLVFSDGSREPISIKDTLIEQTIEFPAHTTTSVRLVFDQVKRGTEFNDLCISEARFSE